MPRLPAHVIVDTNCRGHAVAAVVTPHGTLGIDTPLLHAEAENWMRRLTEQGGRVPLLVQLDASPDRAFAAAHLASVSAGSPPTLVAHQLTAEGTKNLQDSYKNNPLTGALEASSYGLDPLSLRWPRPAMAFHPAMTLHWLPAPIVLQHAPSSTPGACWVHLPKEGVIFIGDAVSLSLPPLLHDAHIEVWLETLAQLKRAPYKGCRLFSSHGGWLDEKDVAHFANFLRAAQRRTAAIREKADPQREIQQAASALLEFFNYPSDRKDFLLRRLQLGLHAAWEHDHAPAAEKTTAG